MWQAGQRAGAADERHVGDQSGEVCAGIPEVEAGDRIKKVRSYGNLTEFA